MAIALVTHVAAGSAAGDTITTASINTTGANFLVAVIADYTGQTTNISDSKTNTWTSRTAYTNGNNRVRIYYVTNPTVGTGHTFTATPALTPTPSYPSIFVASFSSVATTTPYDVENGIGRAGVTSSLIGSVTPGADGELLIASFCNDTAGSGLSIDSSFTILDTVARTANHLGGSMAYFIQTTAAAINPTWSWTTSTNMANSIAAFKASAAANISIPVAMNLFRRRRTN